MGGTEKRGAETKILKKAGGKSGRQGVGVLKKGGWNTMVIVDVSTNPPLVCNKLPS